ncbi:FtsX-like permease family protein [Martelella alba]|uniref:FtsX-like permease family protein n=1 Tax=Martelella alba TaxID=2590451 RepID=A0A506UBH2_9HYPH|nr:FtsX-like permease family protein [Martelella alba]TPW29147.1 FtsX-like permease family protein [Martelella alba]
MLSRFDAIIGRLRAFGLPRLAFAVVTLSMALSGTIANYTLSGNALRHFDLLLELNDAETFVINGAADDVVALTGGRFDAPALAALGPALVQPLLRPGFTVIPFRAFAVSIGDGGAAQLAKVYAVGQGFAARAGLTLKGVAQTGGWRILQDHCLVGVRLAQRIGLDQTMTGLWIDGRYCRIVGEFDAPVRPPFADIADSVVVPFQETSYEQAYTNGFSFLISGPAASHEETRLKALLSLVFDVSRLTIWSAKPIVDQARELKFVASSISVGLSAIILMIGAVSIASLMSFSVTERRREIAIRRTLGATRLRIVIEIVEETLLIASLALVVGIAGGVMLAHVLEQPLSRFFLVAGDGEPVQNVIVIAKAVLGFLLVSLAAGIVPALNAARTDPATVLRES